MTKALATTNFAELQQIGRAMAKSGFFADSKDEAQAVVKILAGQEIGLGPFAAMTGIHIIQGKPVMGANLLATLIKNDHRYDYKVAELNDKNCSIDFFENGENIGNSSFSIADANKAGSKNLAKFPRNMLFARAISNGAKWYTPGIFGGNPVYTPYEIGMDVDEDGDPVVVDAKVVDVTPAPPTHGTAKEHELFSTVVSSTGTPYSEVAKDLLSFMAAAIQKNIDKIGEPNDDTELAELEHLQLKLDAAKFYMQD